MKKTFIACLALAIGVAVVGCKSIAPAPQGVALINERTLRKLIAVESFNNAKTATGTLRVWGSVRNKTKSRLLIEVRPVFAGSGGEPVEPTAAWQPLFIEPNTAASFDVASMSSAVARASVEIREGNR